RDGLSGFLETGCDESGDAVGGAADDSAVTWKAVRLHQRGGHTAIRLTRLDDVRRKDISVCRGGGLGGRGAA
ncbi:carbohydrate kinase fggy, partial [Nannochloropsis gaditana CCMP526]|uniref:carbohydrate kinase fggy n=1 Tax=Nannochloropsis gaditana (strain CCMP526) TaxID=1093141 RepID=UPI00029F6AE7